MRVIARHAIIQQAHLILSTVLPQSFSIGVSIPGKLQQKLPIVTPMGNVKNATIVPAALNPIRPCHGRNGIQAPAGLQQKNQGENRLQALKITSKFD